MLTVWMLGIVQLLSLTDCAQELTRMCDAERLAEEDMQSYLVEDHKGREDVNSKAKELRAEAKVRRRIFEEHSKQLHTGLVRWQLALHVLCACLRLWHLDCCCCHDTAQPINHPAFQFIRYLFQLYDTDNSGYLDENELRKLLKHMAVPATEDEFMRAVEWADKDHSGHLNVEEFIVLFSFLESGTFPPGHEPPDEWWADVPSTWRNGDAAAAAAGVGDSDDDGGSPMSPAARKQVRSKMDVARRAAVKLGMQGMDFLSYMTSQSSSHHFLARKVLTRQARIAAAIQVRPQAAGVEFQLLVLRARDVPTRGASRSAFNSDGRPLHVSCVPPATKCLCSTSNWRLTWVGLRAPVLSPVHEYVQPALHPPAIPTAMSAFGCFLFPVLARCCHCACGTDWTKSSLSADVSRHRQSWCADACCDSCSCMLLIDTCWTCAGP